MLNPTGLYDRVLRRLSRRDLMKAAWALGASAVALPVEARRQSGASMLFNSYPFSLGVASGDPLPDGIVLWTRLAPQPLSGGGMPMVPVNVQWELAADSAFRNVVQKGESLARPELAHSVHVEVNGLQPAHDYWYRFRAGNEVSQVGRTRTAPAAGAAVDRLRFGVCGCSHYETGYFTAYRRIAQEQFDFVIHTGDYIYESRADGGRTEGRVRQHTGDEIYTLVDYRNRYGLYKSDPDLIAAHRSAPFIVSWDDHEVENNYAGELDENGTPAAIFLMRRAAAYQAYYEHMPVRMAAWPTGAHMRIYRRLQFGSLIDLSVLDTRQWRSDQACNDGLRNCPASLEASRTMLGAEQEKWVFDNLANATARWTVLSQQVYSFARDFAKVNPDARFQMDVWDGYPAARQRLYSRIKETKAQNPIVISGDVHVHYGADLKLDFADPKSEVVASEFTNTSVSAGGDGADVAANWEALRGANPHIKYHAARRGYIACTATPAAMRADFRILDRVTVTDLPIRTGGSLVVEAGKRGANIA
jgi:alkaline phosphatase D